MSPKRQRQHERLLAKMKPYQRALMEKHREQTAEVENKNEKESVRNGQSLA